MKTDGLFFFVMVTIDLNISCIVCKDDSLLEPSKNVAI